MQAVELEEDDQAQLLFCIFCLACEKIPVVNQFSTEVHFYR